MPVPIDLSAVSDASDCKSTTDPSVPPTRQARPTSRAITDPDLSSRARRIPLQARQVHPTEKLT